MITGRQTVDLFSPDIMRIAYVSSYPPRKCGVATYTYDLVKALIATGQNVDIEAVEHPSAQYKYPKIVNYVFTQDRISSYVDLAKQLNKSKVDFVHLQHEYALFGGTEGEYILSFSRALVKPFILTLHTVPLTPNDQRRDILQQLSSLSKGIVVMQKNAKLRLVNEYGINADKIHVIYHGVPVIGHIDRQKVRVEFSFDERFVLLANNLIRREKGYEYVIKALPEIKKKIPDVLFVILGETHPVVKLTDGESYRMELKKLVEELGVEENIKFVNRYVSLKTLINYLVSADIFVAPYLNPQQVASGTLAYALGLGKVAIATPFTHAKSLVRGDRGIIVPFRDSHTIAKAVIDVATHPDKRVQIEQKALLFGKQMHWDNVAEKHLRMYRKIRKSLKCKSEATNLMSHESCNVGF